MDMAIIIFTYTSCYIFHNFSTHLFFYRKRRSEQQPSAPGSRVTGTKNKYKVAHKFDSHRKHITNQLQNTRSNFSNKNVLPPIKGVISAKLTGK